MKKFFYLPILAIVFIFSSCSEPFDDSAIWDKLDEYGDAIRDHENRISALEELCKQMNTNISSLQAIVEAIQKNDYITAVIPVTKDGTIIGYTITFAKAQPITIYHGEDGKDGQDGKDGKDGYTPQIGVAKDVNGIYYWTLDGEWLLDGNDDKIKAEGANGEDGITPRLKIEDDYWYISYDNGSTWEQLAKATSDGGEKEDSLFQNITQDDDYVYFYLADGSVLVIAKDKDAIKRITYVAARKLDFYDFIVGNRDGTEKEITIKDRFNANIVSHEWDDSTGKGVIVFDDVLTTIGEYAFAHKGEYGGKLVSVTLPQSLTSIGSYAFEECDCLESITIPRNVVSIGDDVFVWCDRLRSFDGKFASEDKRCLIVDGVLKAFAPAGLTNYSIPNMVVEIGSSAFCGCTSLVSVTIPDSVVSIREYAFGACESFEVLKLGENVASIGDFAFTECVSLKSVEIPNSLISVGMSIFNCCLSLEKISGKFASSDNRCLVVNGVINSFAPAGLTEYVTPSGAVAIGDYAFAYNETLTNIIISNGVISIGEGAFDWCEALTNVDVAYSVKSIGGWAFEGCCLLTTITIPESVTSIGEAAFCDCTSLRSVYCKAVIPPIGDARMFSYYEHTSNEYGYKPIGCTIYVPRNSVGAYKAKEYWNDYASYIVGYDF